ncbi:MAG: alpha/beta hydrolase family protein [Gemmatimonadota bacterium]
MATPTLSKHQLAGALGPILIDVRASQRGTPQPAVLVLHGFKGFKDWGMFPVLAERLARAGFVAVSFNMSGSGVDDAGQMAWPERFGHNTYSRELADVATVIDALDAGTLGVARPSAVGLVGHSRGGGIAVLQAARDARVRCLVTWSAIAHPVRHSDAALARWRENGWMPIRNTRTGEVYRLYTDVVDDVEANAEGSLDILAAAARVRVPWLVIHGEKDETVRPQEAEELAAASGAPATRLLRIPNAGHTFGAAHPWAGSTPALDEVMDATVGWLTQYT